MTLLQRVIVAIPGFVLLLLPLLRGSGGEAWISLFAVIVYGIIAVPLMTLHYFRFRYRITPSEIVIESGIATRRHRSIPLERIHNIEIEQPLLPRLTGTAKVKIETASSTTTEGVLDLVSLEEAHRIRELVRSYQRQGVALPPPTTAGHEAEPPPRVDTLAPDTLEEEESLYRMPLRRVFLSGVFRFSLLYIAVIFSGLEYLNLGPEEIVYNLERGPLHRVAEFALESPWATGLFAVTTAALLSWISGILVNLNRFYGFTLTALGDKLHKKSGLLTVSEGTIPLRRVQAIIFRSNPLMHHYGWSRLELQTMGFDVQQQGHQVAAPFARVDEVLAIAHRVRPFDLPDAFTRVSPLHIRRAFVRYVLLLGLIVGPVAYFWRPALWTLAGIPFLLLYAFAQYRNHGYALDERHLYVRRGVIRHHMWVIPFERFQVFYASASLFQRRLGLKSVYVDTAGAGAISNPEIVDLPADQADDLFSHLYQAFRHTRPKREAASV